MLFSLIFYSLYLVRDIYELLFKVLCLGCIKILLGFGFDGFSFGWVFAFLSFFV